MKGYTQIIRVHGHNPTAEWDGPIPLKYLNDAVGGPIETVPFFNKVEVDGEIRKCVAFCNEEGKLLRLPINSLAQLMWEAHNRHYIDDVLCGDVVIIWGDNEFMQEL